ncbi:MAG TPA: RodZ domain-containing protein [Kamptonema sp.]|nr:RodZ domain-containing protein [Kamptonema sp.]
MTKNLFFLLFKKTKKNLELTDPERAQKLAEIGAQLREFREQHSISLERVSVVTMIRSRLLQAIEEGELNELPEPVYTQGLIKRYAEAMGLDGEQFANCCPSEPMLQPIKNSWRDLPWVQLRPAHLYVLYLLLILASVNGLSQVMSRSDAPERGMTASKPSAKPPSAAASKSATKQPENQGSLVAQAPSSNTRQPSFPDAAVRDDYASSPQPLPANVPNQPTPSNLAKVTNTSEPAFPEISAKITNASDQPSPLEPVKATNASDQPTNQPVSISVTVKEETWAMIEVDGKTEFEGNLPVGTQRTWQAKDQLVFRAGNAGGVLLAVNNGKAKQLGQPGAIEEVVLKAKEPPATEKGKDQG